MKLFKITDKKGVKTSDIIKECRELFPIWVYNEKNIDKEFPPIKKTTTRCFERVVEADEENKNISANEADKKGIKGITLRERLLMELDYFKETGKHLDIDNFTICSGSRYSAGFVPGVYCRVVGVCVYWYDPRFIVSHWRVRSVVSCDTSCEDDKNGLNNLEERVLVLEEFKSRIENILKELK